MSLKLKVLDASKSIYEGLKKCFLEKVKSITEKILQMSKKLKEDKCDLDNSMHFSTSGIIEVQIRTEEMHIEAEYGIAAHFAYKEKIKIEKRDLRKEYEWIDELKHLQ